MLQGQIDGTAVKASTCNKKSEYTLKPEKVQVELLTAHTPICPLAALLRTLPPNKRCDGVVEECLLPTSLISQEELRLRIWHTAQQSPHVGELGHYQSRTCRYYELSSVSSSRKSKRANERTNEHKLIVLDDEVAVSCLKAESVLPKPSTVANNT